MALSPPTRKLSTRLSSRLANPVPKTSPDALRAAVEDRVVVVTGASQGIGRAVAVRLAAAGAHVALVARSADTLDELAAELGDRARPFPCDLADEDQAQALAPKLLDAWGAVDIVVSNAGKSIRRSIADSYDRMHDVTRTTAINYHGPVQLLLGLLPAMRAQGDGHIVNVSTVGVLMPPAPRWAAYVSSKAAFDTWLRSVTAETAADGVTATSIYMALVHTAMSAPSNDFDGVPGLSPDEAAQVVADAIVRRPVTIAPWWARGAAGLAGFAPAKGAAFARHYGRSVQ